jgi:methionyl-tRNA formyltransferase
MGTAKIACPGLDTLHRSSEFNVLAAITQPDRHRGRKLELQPSAVKKTALELGIPVLQPKTLRTQEALDKLADLDPELIVVIAFGQMLPPSVLDLPAHGCVNVHTSLLPKYRGAAPIQWAIHDGETETGVTLMKMDAGLDTGPIIASKRTVIGNSNAQQLHDLLANLGAELLRNSLPGYVSGEILPALQNDSEASHARKITKEDGNVDWQRPAAEIERAIRAFTPWPGAFTSLKSLDPVIIKIHQANVAEGAGAPGEVLRQDSGNLVVACGEKALDLVELQRPGSRRLMASEFLRGFPIKPGSFLS